MCDTVILGAENELQLPPVRFSGISTWQRLFYLVKSVLRHRYRQGWRFLTLWEGFGVEEATWEPFSAFVLPEGRLNSVLVDYLSQNNLGELLRLAETLASKTKARD